jgi:hypothetical protein
VACFLQGCELESLLVPGAVYLFDGTHNFGTADLFRGLMDPTVTLPILKVGALDGVGVAGLASYLSAARNLRHLTIMKLVQMHDIRALVSVCRQNGSLHSISHQ